jgi:hypothetical protein
LKNEDISDICDISNVIHEKPDEISEASFLLE